ncbi:hypothetical protein [Methanobrevibacter ruminantium]|uniref:hypothetical protein n=1 Tax=Methanobrevibacter ruminantium TaxID=83816 RepID=UPI0026EF4CA7|nr:hypothetical protein [Methanobrevibacter ruminantium]
MHTITKIMKANIKRVVKLILISRSLCRYDSAGFARCNVLAVLAGSLFISQHPPPD